MSFLSVIIDCNICNWGNFLKTENESCTYMHVLSGIISFCNAHVLSSVNNRLLVLASGIKGNQKKLFTSTNCNSITYLLSEIESKLRKIFIEYAKNENNNAAFTSYAAAVSLSICAFQRYKRETIDPTGRILIINLTKDLAAEQNILMNLFFSANQQGLEVNVASLNNMKVPILQQACDITSGTHMLIKKSALLAQHLMQCCLNTSSECKEVFFLKKEEDVDYRATCHCHSQLVNIGWVCSVCLSVYCQFMPICTTCNVLFSLGQNQKNTRKRKADQKIENISAK